MAGVLSFLQNCFIIVDLSVSGDENCAEEDELLFFHPPGVSYDPKAHFIGWCTAMINFATNFTNHPLEVANLEKFKVAFKQVGDIAMILSGPIEQPESTLINHLSLLYSAFRFYNRSFQAVMEGRSRALVHQKMAEIGKELVPLITKEFQKNALRSFNPLPYHPLAHKANRHFIQSSQLLHMVESDPGNLSGCVIYKNSVICTHLDFTTTRFILNRLDFNKSSLYATSQPPYSSVRGRMEPVCDFIPVYMLREAVDELIKDRHKMFAFNNIQTVMTPPSTSPFTKHHQFVPPPEEEEDSIDGFVSLGLCIVSVHELSIAILMTYKAFSNKQHIKRSIWKIPADPHFQSLESDLEAEAQAASMQAAAAGNTLPPPLQLYGSPQSPHQLGPLLSEGSPVASRPPFAQPPPLTLFNARIVQSPAYNFLSYDPQTESASVTPLSTPQEHEFAQVSSFMHHTFATEPSITEIIRKDSTGEIFGKHVFGREVFYQLKNGSSISHDKFLEVIEKTVRTALKDDHNINLI